MAPVEFLVLSQEDVVAAGGLDMDACLATIEETLVLHHRRETIAPQKSALHWTDDIDTDEKHGRIMAMPAYVGGSIAMAGMKWIPSVPRNPSRGLPRGIGVVLLSDPETGLPVCFMDGTVVSAMRTGAVSGLAARELARSDARVLTLYGAGVQARTQLAALERTLPGVEQIRVYDPNDSQTARFVAEHARNSTPIVSVADPRRAARGADVLVPATMASSPFIHSGWVEPGMLVLSVSSLDVEVDVVAGADLVVTDDLEHETFHPSRPLSRARDAGALDAEAVVTLGAILAGDHPGRSNDDERILVSPVGLGIEDVAWATGEARRAGVAQRSVHERRAIVGFVRLRIHAGGIAIEQAASCSALPFKSFRACASVTASEPRLRSQPTLPKSGARRRASRRASRLRRRGCPPGTSSPPRRGCRRARSRTPGARRSRSSPAAWCRDACYRSWFEVTAPPPRCSGRTRGLEPGIIVVEAMAALGIESQLTMSPNGWFRRTPSM